MNSDYIRKLTECENLFLTKFKQYFPAITNIKVSFERGCFQITIRSEKTDNHVVIWIEGENIGVGIGKWTHTHFDDINESLLFIDDIMNDFIVVWKVTKNNGIWYSGHYDIRLWQENVEKNDWSYNQIDEPDSQLEPDSIVERSTFNKIIDAGFK